MEKEYHSRTSRQPCGICWNFLVGMKPGLMVCTVLRHRQSNSTMFDIATSTHKKLVLSAVGKTTYTYYYGHSPLVAITELKNAHTCIYYGVRIRACGEIQLMKVGLKYRRIKPLVLARPKKEPLCSPLLHVDNPLSFTSHHFMFIFCCESSLFYPTKRNSIPFQTQPPNVSVFLLQWTVE